MSQHRLNICFSSNDINTKNKTYLELTQIISDLETYFSNFDELKNYELVSNIIPRQTYGIVIRFHLKTLKDKTITPFKQMINSVDESVEWIQFDKNLQFNFNFHPDCLWIDNTNSKYGISFVIDSVFQFIS
jgi:hypothetical protein